MARRRFETKSRNHELIINVHRDSRRRHINSFYTCSCNGFNQRNCYDNTIRILLIILLFERRCPSDIIIYIILFILF